MFARTKTLLSLQQFAEELGLYPLHFAGGVLPAQPVPTCREVWLQYRWKGEPASREEVASVLALAEADLARVCGFWPAPVWLDERQRLRVPYWRTDIRTVAQWGYVQDVGTLSAEAIDPASVSRSADLDADGDGFAEWARFVITNVEPTEITACYKEYDESDAANCRLPPSKGYDPIWELRPLVFQWSDNQVQVWIPVWHLFKPQLVATATDALDASDPTVYVDTVSFYRISAGLPQAKVGTDNSYVNANVRILDARRSILELKPEGSCWAIWPPDQVRLWYRAGYAEQGDGRMDRFLARCLVLLTVSRLEADLCTCSPLVAWKRWREDVSLVTDKQSYQGYIPNPLGSRLGEVEVWRRLMTRGMVLGRGAGL